MTFECGKLTLITGSPRSSTTALHNALVAGEIYRGVLGDDVLVRDFKADKNLYTDEYHPSMQTAIAWTFSTSPTDRDRLREQLVAHIEALCKAFASNHGLMLKAPHYVFGMPAYQAVYGGALQIVYVHRNPFAIAASMLKHPAISAQLMASIRRCMDFSEFDLPGAYAEAEVLGFAAQRWQTLAPFERALFVWYLYANAFLRNIAGSATRFFVIRNETFSHALSRRIVSFLGIDDADALKIEQRYRALPAAEATTASLGGDGRHLWDLIRHVDAGLTALS